MGLSFPISKMGVITLTLQGHGRSGALNTWAPWLVLLMLGWWGEGSREQTAAFPAPRPGWAEVLWLCRKGPSVRPLPPVLQCPGAWVTESLRTLGNKVAPLHQISGPHLCWVGGFLTLEAPVTPRAPVSQPLSLLVLTRAHEAGRAAAAPSQVRWK